MRYKVNTIVRNCIKKECECKSCAFNGIEGMCSGCTECFEHKILASVSECRIIKKGNWSGFGAIALKGSYMISIPAGPCDIPEYFYISKYEFDTFEEWKDDASRILEIEQREHY